MAEIEGGFLLNIPNLDKLLPVGVGIFFVISGFVMVISTHRKQEKPTGVYFLKRRVLRIYPLYIALTLLLAALALTPFINKVVYDAPYLIKSLFLYPVLDSKGGLYPLLMVGWTLIYEMYFYLMFSTLLFFKSKTPAITVFTFSLIPIISGFFVDYTSAEMILISNPIILEFYAGAFLGFLYLKKITMPQNISTIFLLLVPVITGIFLYTGIEILLFVLPFIAVLIAALKRTKTSIENKALLKIGEFSYSLYLTHWFVVALVSGLLKRGFFVGINTDLLLLISFSIALVGGWLCYIILEKPLLVLSKKI